MAIAYDNSTDGGSITSTSLTFAHTCAGNILYVGVSAGSDLVTGVTYNGVQMKFLARAICVSGPIAYVYQLVNPAQGANNVVVTASGSTSLAAMCASYSGANQNDIEDAIAIAIPTGIAGGAWTSATMTTITDQDWAIGFSVKTFTEVPSGANGWTTRQSAAGLCLVDFNAPIIPAGSCSPTVSHTGGSQNYAHIAVAFSPKPSNSSLVFSNAIQYDGSTTNSELIAAGSTANNNFSMAAWVFPIAYMAGDSTFLHNGANDARGQEMRYGSTGIFNADLAFVANISSGCTIPIGHWYHFGLIRDTGVMQLYINGIAQGGTIANAPNSGTDWITLGSSQNSAGTDNKQANCKINEARFYERAITAAEMYTLAHNAAIWPYTDISATSLFFRYKANESSGAPQDSSGNGKNLGNTGSPSWVIGIIATAIQYSNVGSLLTMFL